MRRALLAVASIIAFVLLLVAVAHLEFVRTRVLDWAVARLSRDFGVLVEAEALRYNLFTASVELRNTSLSVPGDRPFLQADAIRIALDRRVFYGVAELERLELDRPRVTIVRHSNGTTNLPASQSDPDSPPSPIHLGNVALRTLSLEVHDESAGHRVTAGPIDLTIDTRAGTASPGAFGPVPVAVTIGSTDDQAPGWSLSGTFGGRLAFDGSRLTLQEMRLDAPEGRVAFDGWIDMSSTTVGVEARGRLETDLAHAGRLFAVPGGALSGSATADVVVRGAMADPTVRVAILGQNVRYQSTPESRIVAQATYSAGRAYIDRIAVTSDAGAIDVSGMVHLAGAGGTAGESRLAARITDLNIDRVLKAAGVALPVEIGSTAAGHFDLALDGGTPLAADAWRRLRADGSVQLTPIGSGVSLDGHLDLAMRGERWTIRHALRSPAGRASLDGTVSVNARQAGGLETLRLAGSTRLQIQEIHGLLPVLQQASMALPPPIDQIDGTLDARIDPRGTLHAPTLNAAISGRRIRVPGVADEGEMDSTVTLDRRALTATSVDARLGQLHATASGQYTWLGQIQIEFKASSNDVGALAVAFDLADASLTGSTEVEGALRGRIESPQGQARLTARDLSAYGVRVGDVGARLQLARERLNIEADAPALRMLLKGGIDTQAPHGFEAEAALDRSPVSALLAAPPTAHIPAEGTIAATVRAKGSLQRLADAAGEIELRALDAKIAGVPMALDTPAVVSLAPTAISATSLHVRVGRETDVRLQGTLATGTTRDGVDVRVESTLADLLNLTAAARPGMPVEAGNSRFILDLHVGGTLLTPEPSGTLALEAASLGYGDTPPFTDLKLGARIEPARIALHTLTAQWQDATLSAEAALPFRLIAPEPRPGATGIAAWGSSWLASLPDEPRSGTLRARATGVTANVLSTLLDPVQLQRIAGTIDATLLAEADAFSLDAVQGSLVLDQASFDLAGVPIEQTIPTRIRFEGGRARLEELRWAAQGNELRASGSARLIGPTPSIDLAVEGALDLRVLGAFATGLVSGGIAQTALTVKGPLASPEIVGGIDVMSGELRLETPSVSASDLYGSITVDGRNATVSLNGFVNGGPTTVWGGLALEALSSPRGRISLAAWNVMLEYPEGFQTESNADLTLTLAPAASTLAGRIDVLSGLYREPLIVSQRLLAGFRGSATPSVEARSSFMAGLRLDVTVATTNDIRIDNNYGRVNLTANLLVTGSAAQPGVVGRVEAAPDGEVFLAGNSYRIQTLTVDLTNPRTIAPEVTFLAETRVKNVPVEIALQCTASGPCEREVRSQATGITNEQAEAMLFGVSTDPGEAGAQLARLLSGELLGIVGGTIGLDTLRLDQGTGDRSDLFDDPTLVAGDVNPASRLTVGKRVGERVELAYSQDLAQNGFVMSTSYFAPAGISLRALLLDNQNRTYEFRHEPPIGARRRPRPQPPPAPVVKAIQFSGNPGFGENELRSQLRLTEGDRFEFAAWQEDRERLRRFYLVRGFFEARVRARRTLDEPAGQVSDGSAPGTVTLEYAAERGSPTRLEVSGFDLPAEVRDTIVERWTGAIFDAFLERDVAVIVREYLYKEGRLRASVTARIGAGSDGSRTLRVEIDPGPVTTRRLQIEGNERVATAGLINVAESVGPLTAWLDPSSVELAIKRLYQQEGFLSAEVDVLEPDIRDGASVVRIVIREGGPWQVGRVTVGGAEQLSDGRALANLGLTTGSRYDPGVATESIAGLEQRFRDAGFLDVRVESEAVLDHTARTADVHVLVAPGPRSVLASVAADGVRPDDPTIARSLNISVGTPVGASMLSDARRRLYESGRYRSVELALEPADGATLPEAGVDDRPVVVRVRVEERPRYSFRYGLSVNSDLVAPDERDTRLGLAADLENRNLFGRGMTMGLSGRLRRDQEVARVYLGANRFFGLPLRSNVFLSRSREDIGSGAPVEEGSPTVDILSDVTEVSAEQIYRLRRFIDLRYGYGLGRNRTVIDDPILPRDLTVRVARLTTSGLIDRRDDPFDPTGGWFTSANLELSRPGLGSDLSFLRSYLQLYHFAPVRRGLVVASAARVGMARTFRGETLIPSERFFAGGATSVRGYYENDLGPRSLFDEADGGSALFVANGEVRFPIYRWARGVGFVDLGDVYPTIGDMLRSVQVGTGAGIRLNTPVGVLRLDLGVPVNRRPFDPKWTVHFGLGHSF